MTLSRPIYRLKLEARRLSREARIPLNVALDRIAAREGFPRWSLLVANTAGTMMPVRIFAALNPGDLLLIAARPGQGKTLMGARLAIEAMRRGHRSVFFTLEYTENDVMRRFLDIGAEHAGGILHRAAAEPGDTDADGHLVGVGDLGVVAAAGFGDHADDRAAREAQQVAGDQEAVHRRVDPGIIDHVVDMAIDIVVHPAAGDRMEAAEAGTGAGRRAGHGDPVEAVAELLDAKVIFHGRVGDIERRTVGGFARGKALFEGAEEWKGHSFGLQFQNEFLMAERDGKILVTTPDLITCLDAESGNPVTADSLRYGLRLKVLAFASNPQWRTPAGLALIGPRYFGYDVDYAPFVG